jgi:hypothetical protein
VLVIKLHKKLFFNFITFRKLKELLARCDSRTQFLETQINNELQIYSSEVSIRMNDNNECSIYINFFEKSDNSPLGHSSFHLYPEKNKNNPSKNGRFHVKGNKNKKSKSTLRFNKVNNTIIISLSKPCYIDSKLQLCVDTAIDILNQYFNKKSKFFLGKPKFETTTLDIPCYQHILNVMAASGKPITMTRKCYHR